MQLTEEPLTVDKHTVSETALEASRFHVCCMAKSLLLVATAADPQLSNVVPEALNAPHEQPCTVDADGATEKELDDCETFTFDRHVEKLVGALP
eukprot:EC786737.1.p3 GENE.EC786737.1~~EC786737.1.p3  ORF type:complete len:94 (-),score=19.55 EC786737.1:158-439(-)